MNDASLLKSVVLIIGTMGSGKSTLVRGLRAISTWLGMKVLDTDECRAPVYEPQLRELRTSQDWVSHNKLWYPQIWGGVMARVNILTHLAKAWPPFFVVDHGGAFITELKQFKVLRGVIALTQPGEVALERVLKREKATSEKAKAYWTRLVESNTGHISSQVEFLANRNVPFYELPTQLLDADAILQAVLELTAEWDAGVRAILTRRGAE